MNKIAYQKQGKDFLKIALELIKKHYEKDESNFRDICLKLLLDCNSANETDVADQITMYMNPDYPHVWGTNDVVTEEDRIKNDIQDLLTAIKEKLKLLTTLTSNENTNKVLENVLEEVFNEN